MSDDEYTPTTDEVREAYADSRWDQYNDLHPWGEFAGNFDRWLAAEKAKWQAEAWTEGVLLVASRHNISVGPDWLRLSNPHRIEEGE